MSRRFNSPLRPAYWNENRIDSAARMLAYVLIFGAALFVLAFWWLVAAVVL